MPNGGSPDWSKQEKAKLVVEMNRLGSWIASDFAPPDSVIRKFNRGTPGWHIEFVTKCGLGGTVIVSPVLPPDPKGSLAFEVSGSAQQSVPSRKAKHVRHHSQFAVPLRLHDIQEAMTKVYERISSVASFEVDKSDPNSAEII